MGSEHTCRVLLIYPRFVSETFWNFAEACELMGARYPAAPLGLITVAAMLPPHWEVRLVDRNTEDLTEADLDWADMVMTGGMLPQQADTLALIELCHRVIGRLSLAVPTRPQVRTSTIRPISGCWEKPRAFSTTSSLPGMPERARHVHRPQVPDRCDQEPDTAFRSDQIRTLSLCWRAVFARLSVHLRVLRHHRIVRTCAAHQDHAANSRRIDRFTRWATEAMSTSSTTT